MALKITKSTHPKDAPSAPQKPAEIKRELVKSPTYFSVYANDIHVQTTPWDLRLILGEIITPATGEEPALLVKQLGEFRLSPQLAKRLVGMMAHQLQAYQERFGEIPVPED